MSKKESSIFEPHWPQGLETRKLYKFQCDDCCSSEENKELSVVVAEDGDVWLGMVNVIHINTEKPIHSCRPSVRCRTGIGGGNHWRTRQALLWLARAIQLDNEEQAR